MQVAGSGSSCSPERRCSPRTLAGQVVAVKYDGYAMAGFSRDLSSDGIFFTLHSPLPPDSRVELLLPVSLESRTILHCFGRVVRVERPLLGCTFGVAVRFDEVQVIPEDAEMYYATDVEIQSAEQQPELIAT